MNLEPVNTIVPAGSFQTAAVVTPLKKPEPDPTSSSHGTKRSLKSSTKKETKKPKSVDELNSTKKKPSSSASKKKSKQENHPPGRLLVRYRTCHVDANSCKVLSPHSYVTTTDARLVLKSVTHNGVHKRVQCWEYSLKRGGKLWIYPNFLSQVEQETIAAQLDCRMELMRQYQVRNYDEPRLHFLLHTLPKEETLHKQQKQQGSSALKVGPGEELTQEIGIVASLRPQTRSRSALNPQQQQQQGIAVEVRPEEASSQELGMVASLRPRTRSRSDLNQQQQQEGNAEDFGPEQEWLQEAVSLRPKTCSRSALNVTAASSVAEAPGYLYHSVHMSPVAAMSEFPAVVECSQFAARLSGLCPTNGGRVWNIGVDVLLYRDGNDRISWHADDTQNEEKIFCVIVRSPEEEESGLPLDSVQATIHSKVRPLKIKPKGCSNPGDEHDMELYMAAGDAYEMDGEMQQHYLHALMKSKKAIDSESLAQNGQSYNLNNRRLALIFRHGEERETPKDSGRQAESLAPKIALAKRNVFGNDLGGLCEGGLYLRSELRSMDAHLNDRGGVSGNKDFGADAIVVSRQDTSLGESDQLSWLRYSSRGDQRGGAMFKSFMERSPVRVFRSSSLENEFAPPAKKPRKDGDEDVKKHANGASIYRYDGLYQVTNVLDPNSSGRTPQVPPRGKQLYTFTLERLPAAGDVASNSRWYNAMDISAYWQYVRDLGHFCEEPARSLRGKTQKSQQTRKLRHVNVKQEQTPTLEGFVVQMGAQHVNAAGFSDQLAHHQQYQPTRASWPQQVNAADFPGQAANQQYQPLQGPWPGSAFGLGQPATQYPRPLFFPRETLAERLYRNIEHSSDKLFFIQYRHDATTPNMPFLVQVDLQSTHFDPWADPGNSGWYDVHFYLCHPDDENNVKKEDTEKRFWPRWHRYTMGDDERPTLEELPTLFPPHVYPDQNKFAPWTHSVHLLSPECYIDGPFDFELRPNGRSTNMVSHRHWDNLHQDVPR